MSSGYVDLDGNTECKINLLFRERNKKKIAVCMIVHFCVATQQEACSLTVVMESTVALHPFVHFSMESSGENSSLNTQTTSALAEASPASPANELCFGVCLCFFWWATFVSSFELKFSISHVKWEILSYV